MIKKFDKKTLLCVLACLLITAMGLFSYFSSSIAVFKDQDLTFHLNRFVGLAKAFEEGQILPKIYPYANNGFGYASPLFYCDLFLYPFGILNHFGVPAVYCYKLCVFIYTLMGNLIVCFILKKETGRNDISLIGVLLYFSANYHLQNIFIRNALGEILAMTFIPLVVYAIYKVLVKKEDCFIFLGVSFSLLVMAHLITTLLYGIFFFCMIIVFIIINRKDKQLLINTFKTILKGSLLALLLTAWYLLPMFEQLHSQTFWLSINAKYNYIGAGTYSLGSILEIFGNEFMPSTGIVLLIFGIVGLIVLKNKYIKIIGFYCILLYLIILGILPGEYLNVIQFYFRLYVVIFPLFTIITVYLLDSIKNKKVFVFSLSIILVYCLTNLYICNQSVLNSKTNRLNNNATVQQINSVWNDNLLDYNHDELGGAEYLPYTEYLNYNDDSLAIKYIDKNNEIVDYIYDYDRSFTEIKFACENDLDLELLLPLSWYKGYKAYELIDNKWVEIESKYSSLNKEVVINSSKGDHTYKVKYTGTFVQYFSLGVSFICLISLFVYQRRKS